jgi:hypothetical protein
MMYNQQSVINKLNIINIQLALHFTTTIKGHKNKCFSYNQWSVIQPLNNMIAGPSIRAVLGVDLRPLACCDRGFESHPGHGCLSVVSAACCQVEVSATD